MQNFVVIGRVHVKREHCKNLVEFDRNIISGTGARYGILTYKDKIVVRPNYCQLDLYFEIHTDIFNPKQKQYIKTMITVKLIGVNLLSESIVTYIISWGQNSVRF